MKVGCVWSIDGAAQPNCSLLVTDPDSRATTDCGHGRHVARLSAYGRILSRIHVTREKSIEHRPAVQSERSREAAYVITSAPKQSADAAKLLSWWRGHRGIEQRSNYVRVVTLGEEASRGPVQR
jgi:hypothetical protein